MNKKTNRKAAPDETPEKLTYEQIIELADGLAYRMEGAAVTRILLLMQEIASHPFDHSHVETVANVTATYLFAHTPESDAAYRQFINAERAKVQKGGGGR